MPELNEAWMRRLKVGPLALDDALLDLRKEFRTRLYESLLTNGWDTSHSMIVATSDDPRLDGQILQGRHRAIIISQILKDGHKFDISKILIRREEVQNIDELRAKRAAYEATASLTKDPKLSKKWIESNLLPIVKSRSQEGHTKILAYLHECGFYQDGLASELIERELDKLELNRKKKIKVVKSSIPAHLASQSWIGPAPELIDDATSYIRKVAFKCEKCGYETTQDVNIAVSHTGDLLKIAAAR